MKIFLTIELIGLLLAIWFFAKRSSSETTTGYSGGGMIRHYTYSIKGYKEAEKIGYASIAMLVIGLLYFIWI